MKRLAFILILPLVLLGCQTVKQSPAEIAKAQACRTKIDQITRIRDRSDLYRTDQRDSPFSSSYAPGITTRGLGTLFGRDRMQSECLRGEGDAAPDAGTGPAFTPQAR